VKCKSSNQEIVSDGFCNEIKPETNANCTTTENLMAFNQEQNCNTEICADCSSYTLVSCPTNANCSQCTE
jgi:hypothetical protein